MENKPSRKAITFQQFLLKAKDAMALTEERLRETRFYIYRTDNQQVLARDIEGYDAAKAKANHIRHQLNLRWDQLKFKAEKHSSPGTSGIKSGIDYASRYNSSKRGHFRGYYGNDGSYHDID